MMWPVLLHARHLALRKWQVLTATGSGTALEIAGPVGLQVSWLVWPVAIVLGPVDSFLNMLILKVTKYEDT